MEDLTEKRLNRTRKESSTCTEEHKHDGVKRNRGSPFGFFAFIKVTTMSVSSPWDLPLSNEISRPHNNVTTTSNMRIEGILRH